MESLHLWAQVQPLKNLTAATKLLLWKPSHGATILRSRRSVKSHSVGVVSAKPTQPSHYGPTAGPRPSSALALSSVPEDILAEMDADAGTFRLLESAVA